MSDAKKKPLTQGKKKDPHAVALGQRGGRKGGVARAKAMAPEERKASAQKAAQARWSIPKATHVGELKIGDLALPCAVLEDSQRVLSQVGLYKALASGNPGRKRQDGDTYEGPVLLSPKNLRPFISADLMTSTSQPIAYRYRLPHGGWKTVDGYPAQLIPDICEAWLKARDAGALHYKQVALAVRADALVRALAKTGIIALVDEATGYQYDRARDELQTILKQYIREELLPWTQKFSNDFFREVYKIHGYEFAEGKAQRPGYIGHFIRRYIYEALPAGVIEELERKNPTITPGRRRHKHFQYLTEDTGNPHLDRQIISVMTLLRVANDKAEFKTMFKKIYPQKGDQVDLRFPREEEE